MKSVVAINTPNQTDYFVPISSTGWELRSIAMKASTAISDWMAVWVEISGNDVTWYATLMWVENAAGADFIGILAEEIVATDTDYATAGKLKQVWIPTNLAARAQFDVWAWTFTAVDVGRRVEFHSDSAWLAVDTVWKWAVITKYISASKWECSFNLPLTETA